MTELFDQDRATLPGPVSRRTFLCGRGVSRGWFSGGFRLTSHAADSAAICAFKHANIGGQLQTNYYSGGWVDPFQYYQSTANPHHLSPASVDENGHKARQTTSTT